MSSSSLYSKLPDDGDSFRVLRLLPLAEYNNDESILRLEIVPARLSDKSLVYEALSYVWGPPGDEKAVEVDCQEVLIRPSLHQILLAQRDPSEPRHVFADAICINQHDDVEKGYQVQLMGKIYKRAERTLSYLGLGDDRTDALFAAAKTISRDDFIHDATAECEQTGPNAHTGKWKQGIFPADEFAQHRKAMKGLVSRDYWRRAWIVQECLLAQDITIICGRASLSWDEFLIMYYFLINKPAQAVRYTTGAISEDGPNKSRFDHMAFQRTVRHDFPWTLARIVLQFQNFDCLDPRDTIYAFLELVLESESGHPGRIVADYTVTRQTLFFRAMHAYLCGPAGISPHNVLWAFRTRLKLTPEDVLQAVLELVDPEELECPVWWFTGATENDMEGRGFRMDRKMESNLTYMERHARDFGVLVKLADQRARRNT